MQLWWKILALFRCHKVNVLHRLRCGWQENGDDIPLLLDPNTLFCRAHDLPVVCILAGTAQSTVPTSMFPMQLHCQEHQGSEMGASTSVVVQAGATCTLAPMSSLEEETWSKALLLRTLFQMCGEGGKHGVSNPEKKKGQLRLDLETRQVLWKDFTDILSKI